MGPWAEAWLNGVARGDVSDSVSALRIEPSLITARVDGRAVTLSAPTIPAGIWAAIESHVPTDRQSTELLQLLEHTWEEPLVPGEVVTVGAGEDVGAVVVAVADEIERDPSVLLRFRGYPAVVHASDDAWHGSDLPPLPPPARRPPDSVPKRFGTSGISTADGDLVETLIRAYRAFGE